MMIWALVLAIGVGLSLLIQRQRLRESLKECESKLRDSNERYRILTENLAASIIVHDAKGEISWCSPFTEVLTGTSRSEIYQRGADFLRQTIHEEDRLILERALGIVKAGEPFQYRFRLQHKTGIVVWVEARTVPIIDQSAEPDMALTILLDATASMLYQQQIEERNRELHDFTYMVSHDLKSPIFTIKGMATILREESKDPECLVAIDHIDRATRRLEHLVGGILELAQVGSGASTRQEVDLSTVVHEVQQDFDAELKGIGATLELPQKLPKVEGDPRMLYQILSNLVGNAIKYRHAERALKVSLDATVDERSRRVALSVRDNGRGISKEHYSHVFRPFSRLGRQDVEGTGVGLACVKRLAEKIGAEVSFESDGSSGTTFRVSMLRTR